MGSRYEPGRFNYSVFGGLIRGLAGAHPIVPEVGLALGRAVAVWSEGPVLVARDTRPSGASLTAAVMAGAAAQGALVRDLGIAPTPAVGCALADGLGAAAVVVTASHNAWPDNGFKVLGAGGRKPTPEDVRALEALVASPPAPPSAFGEIAAEPDALGRWLSRMPVTPELAGMKIAIDLANGAAAVAQDWLEKSDVEWVVSWILLLTIVGCRRFCGLGARHGMLLRSGWS